jgi:hypothetical protein
MRDMMFKNIYGSHILEGIFTYMLLPHIFEGPMRET